MNKDHILRASAGNGSVRIFVADTKQTAQTSFDLHKTSPVMSAAMGRALTAAAIMGTMLKNTDDLVSIQIKGDGEGGGLTVTADNSVNVKGYPYNPMVDIPLKPNGKLDVQGALGYGTLTVIKDMGLKEPYVGQIPLVSGEIAEDLTYYFAKSEQTPSAVALGVLVDRDYTIKQSGGFIVQMMPDADDDVVAKLEQKLAGLDSVTNMLENGMTTEDILNEIAGEFDPQILDRIPVNYHCNCSRERVEKALISIGKKELAAIIEEDGKASMHCHFCNKDYEFNKAELEEILKNAIAK
jgi:molecular chaperone Hsp33